MTIDVTFVMRRLPCLCCFECKALGHNIWVRGRGITEAVENIRIACALHFSEDVEINILFEDENN